MNTTGGVSSSTSVEASIREHGFSGLTPKTPWTPERAEAARIAELAWSAQVLEQRIALLEEHLSELEDARDLRERDGARIGSLAIDIVDVAGRLNEARAELAKVRGQMPATAEGEAA